MWGVGGGTALPPPTTRLGHRKPRTFRAGPRAGLRLAVKEFKLNAERNNGRAAMMGIIGMMIHEGLTGNPIWPIDYEPGKFPLIPLEAVWPGIFSMGNPYPSI